MRLVGGKIGLGFELGVDHKIDLGPGQGVSMKVFANLEMGGVGNGPERFETGADFAEIIEIASGGKRRCGGSFEAGSLFCKTGARLARGQFGHDIGD